MNEYNNRAARRSASASAGVPMTRGANRPHEELARGISRDVYREKRREGVRVRKAGVSQRTYKGEIVRRVLLAVKA